MTWLLVACLAASLIGNLALLVVIWDMTSRHHAHALTLIDVSDELTSLRQSFAAQQEEVDRLKASGRLLL